MAPGSSAQKKKKELETRRERKAAEALRVATTATTMTTSEAVRDTLVPIPSLEDTNPSGLGNAGGGTDSGGGKDDDGHPISIRTKRGLMEPEVVDMRTGK